MITVSTPRKGKAGRRSRSKLSNPEYIESRLADLRAFIDQLPEPQNVDRRKNRRNKPEHASVDRDTYSVDRERLRRSDSDRPLNGKLSELPPDLRTFFTILGVSPSAPLAEVEAAFRRQMLVLHPDRHQGNSMNAREGERTVRELARLMGQLRDLYASEA